MQILDNPNAFQAANVKSVYGQQGKLSAEFLASIQSDNGGVILIEAFKPTDKPLKVVIRKKGSGEKIAEVAFPLNIDRVDKMYRHLNLLAANGQSGGLRTSLSEQPKNMPDAYCSDKNFVFVHGYNVTPEEAQGWFAEMFKRLWHSGSRAKFTGVTWYGYESRGLVPLFSDVTPDYQANVLNAFGSASALKQGLQSLSGPITIAAHSLGNMVVGSAMADWGFSAANYFMIDAAVAKECYDESEEQIDVMSDPVWENYPGFMRATEWHALPWPANDWRRKLTWKNRLEGVTNAFNFYSTGEEVLQNPPHGSAPGVSNATRVWANQEKRKGLGITGWIYSSRYGGWDFNRHPDYTIRVYNPEGQWVERFKTAAELESKFGDLGSADFKERLKSIPVFDTGFDPVTGQVDQDAPSDIQNLYGANGGAYASPERNRNRLLAEMIPARSTAAGSNPIAGIPSFDMNANKNGWPRDDQMWRHSDIREVAYCFTYKTFEKIVNLGGLNQ